MAGCRKAVRQSDEGIEDLLFKDDSVQSRHVALEDGALVYQRVAIGRAVGGSWFIVWVGTWQLGEWEESAV